MRSKIKEFLGCHEKLFGLAFFLAHLREELASFTPFLIKEDGIAREELAFHGDEIWREMVARLIDFFNPTSIIETGTFKGHTTSYLANIFEGNVFSCEVVGMYYRESRYCLRNRGNVKIFHGSSSKVLNKLVAENLLGYTPLFFLDAHWYSYWPLCDELAVIKKLPRAIIMIDDFRVPQRPNFGYESQAKNGIIVDCSLDMISAELSKNNEHNVIFPKYGSGNTHFRGYITIFQDMEKEFHEFMHDDFVNKHYREYSLKNGSYKN